MDKKTFDVINKFVEYIDKKNIDKKKEQSK